LRKIKKMESTLPKGKTPALNKRIVVGKNTIIKVQEETADSYIGFDIFSEQLYRLKKTPQVTELPQYVIKLLGCQKSRFKLANALALGTKSVGNILNIAERTAFRMYIEYDMFDENTIAINEKISTSLSKTKNKQKKQLV